MVTLKMVPSSGQSDASNDVDSGRLLDGFLLLAAGGSSSPEDVVRVNLSSLHLIDVASEDLSFFVHLDRLDASDNQLSYEQVLQQIGRIPRLSTLALACNSISSLEITASDLPNLQHLDLSFNELRGDVMGTLALLPALVSLNLASNCISSMPVEEELAGFQALEELILDANDLVQFVQWRALDALPLLRKLSLASNRVKRLKDDAPFDNGEVTYFRKLEELNLSDNEIADVELLPVVRCFRSLRTLVINDNPCMRGPNAARQKIRGISVTCEQKKPFYLKGSGCHQVRPRRTEPRLKMQRGKMRKVRSSPQILSGSGPNARQWAPRSCAPLGVIDTEANELLVSLTPDTMPATDPRNSSSNPELDDSRPATRAIVPVVPGIFSDELSEEELDQIFKERRATIAKKFNAELEEPASFMRQAPFAISAAAGQKLRPVSSSAFLTSVGEDSVGDVGNATTSHVRDSCAGPSKPSVLSLGSTGGFVGTSAIPSQAGNATPHGGLDRTRADGTATTPSASFVLPPIPPGSRGSSAGGSGIGGERSERGERTDRTTRFAPGTPSDTALVLPHAGPGGGAFGTGGRQRIVPDVSVREAMRALRAAAMSEYAVTAG